MKQKVLKCDWDKIGQDFRKVFGFDFTIHNKREVYCLKCGLIKKYTIVKSPRIADGKDFKYSKCKCGSKQPLCLGEGCIDVIGLSCPSTEYNACSEILNQKIKE